MAFAVNTPDGGQVRLEDLPLSVLSKMERESEVRWPILLAAPASSALSALTVYRVACEHVGAEPAELTARDVLTGDIFAEVDDDLPTLFEDGAPKAGDETPTGGSSGDSPAGDGPPT